MKPFLKKVACFLLLPTMVLLVVFIGLNKVNKTAFNNYHLDENIHTVLIGDSHIQMTLNDSVLPNTKNLSRNAETFLFSYYKLATLLQQNPSLKRVFLGYGYHSLSNNNDNYTFGMYSKDIATRYFFILPLAIQTKMMATNGQVLPSFIKNALGLGWSNINPKQDYSFLGFYENTFKNAAVQYESIEKGLQNMYFDKGTMRPFSEDNIFYLQEIVNLCKSKNVQLTLVNTPIHPKYKSGIPSEYKHRYYSIVKDNNLTLFEFDNLVLTDSCFVTDGDHVSVNGSLLTTDYFKLNYL
jgi:hypothetical protein